MDRRDHTRYGVKALVDFKWIVEGVIRRGKGVTRDISSKGMFIRSDTKPPAKADLELEVFFRDFSDIPTNLQMRVTALVIRVEPETFPGPLQGFAVLNKRYELHDGSKVMQED